MGHTVASLFFALLAAHLLADFPLQTAAMAKAKQRGWHGRKHTARHALIHVITALVVAGIYRPAFLAAVIAAAIGLTHFLIDSTLKPFFVPEAVRKDPKAWRRKLAVFAADQTLHVMVIGGLVLLVRAWTRPGTLLVSAWANGLAATALDGAYVPALIYVSGFLLAVYVGGVVVGLRVEPFLAELNPKPPDEILTSLPRGFEGGGRLIGTLERALVFPFVVLGQYAAIGFLLAAKSVLRFSEIKAAAEADDGDSRKEPEYVLIGTMLSVAWAIGAALLTLATLALVPGRAGPPALPPSSATMAPLPAPTTSTTVPTTNPTTTLP
jgi:hypothetical protein